MQIDASYDKDIEIFYFPVPDTYDVDVRIELKAGVPCEIYKIERISLEFGDCEPMKLVPISLSTTISPTYWITTVTDFQYISIVRYPNMYTQRQSIVYQCNRRGLWMLTHKNWEKQPKITKDKTKFITPS